MKKRAVLYVLLTIQYIFSYPNTDSLPFGHVPNGLYDFPVGMAHWEWPKKVHWEKCYKENQIDKDASNKCDAAGKAPLLCAVAWGG